MLFANGDTVANNGRDPVITLLEEILTRLDNQDEKLDELFEILSEINTSDSPYDTLN